MIKETNEILTVNLRKRRVYIHIITKCEIGGLEALALRVGSPASYQGLTLNLKECQFDNEVHLVLVLSQGSSLINISTIEQTKSSLIFINGYPSLKGKDRARAWKAEKMWKNKNKAGSGSAALEHLMILLKTGTKMTFNFYFHLNGFSTLNLHNLTSHAEKCRKWLI